ncbi:MAG: hypothetical protein FWC68_05595, partial [Oscillospiraceae bacterium]|nr:hypothetical protein [Oscillospiraceae bacterium]
NIAGTDGGGVLIQYSFMMHDGEINGNAATNRGGGVFMEDESFIMSGGEISENTAGTDGGGVFTNNRLVIHGGEISRNTAQQNGGGVYTLHLTMHDGEINANIAYGNGGGMYLINDCCCHEYDAERAMYGGRISNNIANNGGGVFINHNDGNIQSLTIKSVFVFTGNVARDGLYINNPMASLNPQIEPETISIIGTHAFTNYDINVRNEPQDRVYLVTFAVRDGLGGTLTSGNTTVTGQQIGQVVVEYGTEILFTAAPDNNWESKAWYINNVRQTGEIANILTYIVEGSGPHHIEILFTVEEQIQVFNLALRTFITQVETNGNVTNLNRAPVVTMPDNFLTGLVYTFPLNKVANPVQMANGSYVVHTIRVFNEGTLAGYVNEIRNEIPQGLEFVPNHPINVNYEWVINGTELRTRYLENNQIGAFNPLLPIETGNPEYRDVQIVLRITGTGNNQPGNVLRIQASIEEAEAVGNGQAEYINLLEEEIDTEYVEIQYFDLGLTKWINFVEVTTGGSTRTRNYAMPADARGSDFLVMTSIRRRDIMSSRVEVAYTIRIRNEAQIEGYAREITLNVPEGMMLVPANNPLWELVDSNTAITRQLEDVLLEEGEYTDIEVILTWRNSGENFGAKRSVATITESYNSSGSLDIDESNDYDYAVKMVVKATGGTDIAMTVIGMMMALSVLGLVSTMKKVEMQV